jgi:hypothetical protein
MRSEYFLAKFNGETFRALKTGSQHHIVVRRRFWRGYTAGVCRGYEMTELKEYQKSYDSLAELLNEWEILQGADTDSIN